MASWATRTPAIRDLLALSTAEMGDCIIWTFNRFDERHPLLSVAGQSIRHP
ncbi:major facilitator superfamily protein [Klebsiella michiganensis]|nr:major facilitator superfamily protein [Klebsiella michiganensis]